MAGRPVWLFLARHRGIFRAVVTVVAATSIAIVVGLSIIAAARQAEVNTCHRVNILRASTNRDNLADYRFELGEISLERVSLGEASPVLGRLVTRHIRELQRQAAAKEWIMLTRCHDVVYEGRQPPNPVRFSRRTPPLVGALVLGPEN